MSAPTTLGMLIAVVLLVGCGTTAPAVGEASAADPRVFCEELADLDPPEPGGNNAEALTDLLELADPSIIDAVTAFRDYHRDVYVEGNDRTDTYGSLPDEVRAAVDRIDRHCGS